MGRWLAVSMAAVLTLLGAATAGELEAGFRHPPADCMPAKGWFLGKAFAEGLKSAPEEVRLGLERALADGGLSTTPEEIKRSGGCPSVLVGARRVATWRDTVMLAEELV